MRIGVADLAKQLERQLAPMYLLYGEEPLLLQESADELRAACPVSYTHLRAHETVLDLVCRLLLEKKKNTQKRLATSDIQTINHYIQ